MPTLPNGGMRWGIGLAINPRVVQLSDGHLLPTRSVSQGSLKRQMVKRVGINAHPTKRWHALGNWVGHQSACCPAVGWVLVAHAFRVPRQPETANRTGIPVQNPSFPPTGVRARGAAVGIHRSVNPSNRFISF